jgi:hypothetical protein
MWYQNDPLGGNSNILHGFLPPNITCPLQALKQRLETESTFFQRLQLDRVGEGPGHGELGGSLAKTKKNWQFYRGKWWKLIIKIDQLWDSGTMLHHKDVFGLQMSNASGLATF